MKSVPYSFSLKLRGRMFHSDSTFHSIYHHRLHFFSLWPGISSSLSLQQYIAWRRRRRKKSPPLIIITSLPLMDQYQVCRPTFNYSSKIISCDTLYVIFTVMITYLFCQQLNKSNATAEWKCCFSFPFFSTVVYLSFIPIPSHSC